MQMDLKKFWAQQISNKLLYCQRKKKKQNQTLSKSKHKKKTSQKPHQHTKTTFPIRLLPMFGEIIL